jgi:hypothetical protein
MRANMKRLALCSLLAALFAGVVVAPAWAGGIGPLKARIVSVLDELGVTTGGVYAGGGFASWSEDASGDIVPDTDNADDIGTASSGVRTLYADTSVVTPLVANGAVSLTLDPNSPFDALITAAADRFDAGTTLVAAHTNHDTQSVTTTVTLEATSAETVLVSSSGAYTITLPAVASAGAGRCYVLRCASSVTNANRVTIDADGAETIDGAANLVISTPYTVCELTCDGTEWTVTRWVMGQPSAFTATGVTMTTNTTTVAYVEQPAPRVVRCQVRVSFSGVPDTATLVWDAAPPGFTIDETTLGTGNTFPSGVAVFVDASNGTLSGYARYSQAANTIQPVVLDELAGSTHYLTGVTEGTDQPVSIANGDYVEAVYTLRVQ